MAPQRPQTPDPVVATYDVYLTTTPASTAHALYILQCPARDRNRPFNAAHGTQPLEMRVKPRSGFLELDVPIPSESYDAEKGQSWCEAMAEAQADGMTSFGLAGGLGQGGTGGSGYREKRRREEDESDEDLNGDREAGGETKLMRQTYGGQIMKDEDGKPFYMIGAFKGQELHLTKVDGIVQMRPQFHYIDAKTHVEKNSMRQEREGAEAVRALEPRYVQMHARSVDNDNEREVDTTKEFMQVAQDESWTRLKYHDEDAEEAYEAFHDKAFVQDTANATKLVSSMTNEEYVDAISAPRLDAQGRVRKKPTTKRQRNTVEVSDDSEVSDRPEPV